MIEIRFWLRSDVIFSREEKNWKKVRTVSCPKVTHTYDGKRRLDAIGGGGGAFLKVHVLSRQQPLVADANVNQTLI